MLDSAYNRFIRYGLILMGLAGYIFAVGDAFIPQEGAMFQATDDPAAFAELVTTDNFRIWALRGLIGVPLEIIGSLALFFGLIGTKMEKWAFWGMLLCILCDPFGTGLFAIMYYVFPGVGEQILAGNTSAASIASMEAFMPILAITFIVTAVGLAFFAYAIWNTDVFPRWSGILVVVGWLLILVQTSYIIQILANVVWGSSFLWMAASSWKRFSASSSD
jgi:hypothetical protein